MFAPGTTKIEPPTNVLTMKSPPELKSDKEVKAESNALFKPSASPGPAPIVNQLSDSRLGKAAKKSGLTDPPKSAPTASL